jgi:hypothetical protein
MSDDDVILYCGPRYLKLGSSSFFYLYQIYHMETIYYSFVSMETHMSFPAYFSNPNWRQYFAIEVQVWFLALLWFLQFGDG